MNDKEKIESLNIIIDELWDRVDDLKARLEQYEGPKSQKEYDRESEDSITCVERALCSTGMPLPCGHQGIYDRRGLGKNRGSL